MNFTTVIINGLINLMPLTREEISKMIMNTFPNAKLELKDTAGDNNHYEAKITSKIFNGKSRVEQHKMVYKALKKKGDTTENLVGLLEFSLNSAEAIVAPCIPSLPVFEPT